MTWLWDLWGFSTVRWTVTDGSRWKCKASCLIRMTSSLLVGRGLIRRVHQMQTAPSPSSSSPPSAPVTCFFFQHTEESDGVKWFQCSCNFQPEVKFDLSFPSVWSWNDVISSRGSPKIFVLFEVHGRVVLWCYDEMSCFCHVNLCCLVNLKFAEQFWSELTDVFLKY